MSAVVEQAIASQDQQAARRALGRVQMLMEKLDEGRRSTQTAARALERPWRSKKGVKLEKEAQTLRLAAAGRQTARIGACPHPYIQPAAQR